MPLHSKSLPPDSVPPATRRGEGQLLRSLRRPKTARLMGAKLSAIQRQGRIGFNAEALYLREVALEHSAEILFPYVRLEVVSSLSELADLQYQRQHWKGAPFPKTRFDDVIHRLFDDTPLADNPECCVGSFLKSQAELTAIRKVMSVLDIVFDRYGFDLIDIDYTYTPEWVEVVALAQEAVSLIDMPRIS